MGLGGLIKKEFGRIKADKRALLMTFAIPCIVIVVFGLASGGGAVKFFDAAIISKDQLTAIDYDTGNQSHEYEYAFVKAVRDNCSNMAIYEEKPIGYHFFSCEKESDYEEYYDDCYDLLKEDKIDVFIILWENFSECVERDLDPTIEYVVDGSDERAVEAIGVAIEEPISYFKYDTNTTTNFTILGAYYIFEVPFWESQTFNYWVPTIVPMAVLGAAMVLTILTIRSEAPLPRMLLTPTNKKQIIVSKYIANSAVMMLQVLEVFLLTLIFGIYCEGSLFDVFLILVLLGLCGVSMGIFISAIASSEHTANQLYIGFFIFMTLFSGALVNPILLPLGWQYVVYAFPMANARILLIEVGLRGKPLNLAYTLILGIIALVYIVMAYLFYQLKTEDV